MIAVNRNKKISTFYPCTDYYSFVRGVLVETKNDTHALTIGMTARPTLYLVNKQKSTPENLDSESTGFL